MHARIGFYLTVIAILAIQPHGAIPETAAIIGIVCAWGLARLGMGLSPCPGFKNTNHV